MNSLKDLYDLIHSMTMNEKRYFRLCATKKQKDESSHYLRLFEILNKSETYEQDAVVKKLKKTNFSDRLSYTQNYLHNHIMDVLRQFRRDKTSTSKVIRLIEEVQILFDNGLIRKAGSTLRRARKELEKNTDESLLPLLLRWEATALVGGWNQKATPELFEQHYQEQQEGIKALKYSYEVRAIEHQVITAMQSGHDIRSECIRNDLASKIDRLENVERSIKSSKSSNFAALSAIMMGNFALSRLDKALLALQEQRAIMANDPNLFKQFNTEVTINSVIIAAQLERGELCDSLLKELEQIVSERKIKIIDQDFLEDQIPSLRLLRSLYLKDFNKAHREAKEFAKHIEADGLKSDLTDYVNIYIPIPLSYFLAEDYKAALDGVNHLLNNFEWGNRTSVDHEYFLRLLEVMCHYELNSVQILPSRLRSLKRFLKSSDRLYKFENIFLRLYRDLSTEASPTNQASNFKNAANQLREICIQDPLEDRMQRQIFALDYFTKKACNYRHL